jgi:hypothetical protein
MKKLVVIKNKQLDLLCNERDANAKELRVQTSFLELVITKIETSSTKKEIIITQSSPQNSISFPIDEFLRQSLDYDPLAKHVCI